MRLLRPMWCAGDNSMALYCTFVYYMYRMIGEFSGETKKQWRKCLKKPRRMNTHKLQLLASDRSIFTSIAYKQGSVLVYKLLGTPHPPSKSCNRILLYRSFHKEVRLGGWGSEGPTLGRHASACATILRLCALLYLRASH